MINVEEAKELAAAIELHAGMLGAAYQRLSSALAAARKDAYMRGTAHDAEGVANALTDGMFMDAVAGVLVHVGLSPLIERGYTPAPVDGLVALLAPRFGRVDQAGRAATPASPPSRSSIKKAHQAPAAP